VEKEESDLTPVTRENLSLEDWKRSWMARHNDPAIFISAVEKQNIDTFRKLLVDQVRGMHMVRYPNYMPGHMQQFIDYDALAEQFNREQNNSEDQE
jgi:hypothetical protein